MRDTRCQQCADMAIIHTACQSCKDIEEFENLMSGQLTALPKIDMGSPFVAAEEAQEHYDQGVSPEEKQGLTDNALIHHGEREEFKVRVHYPNPVLVGELVKERIKKGSGG